MAKQTPLPILQIWSGSGVISKEGLQEGLKGLNALGFKVQLSKNVRKYSTRAFNKKLPFISGSDLLKAQELKKILSNPRENILLATRGGYGVLRVLPFLDQLKVKRKKPLVVWGYSDLTILQLYFYSRFKWPYIQGPLLGSSTFSAPTEMEKAYLKKVAESFSFQVEFSLRYAGKEKLKQKKALLIGGNLASIVAMLGTTWEPKLRDKYILFVEDIGEPAYKLDRLLHQLLYSQFFKNCVGIVLGHFTDCPNYREVFQEFAAKTKVPLLEGLPMGHESPRIPFVLGKQVTIVHKKNSCLMQID